MFRTIKVHRQALSAFNGIDDDGDVNKRRSHAFKKIEKVERGFSRRRIRFVAR